jgi:predicted nuclease of predicted toxin-antitoxin system
MIRLLLDEDVPEAIAVALRLRGYNAETVRESGRKGLTDIEQLNYAHSEQRIFLTHNIADFVRIHLEYIRRGKKHCGIILSRQLPVGVIVKALLKFLSDPKAKDIQNQVIWLSEWII